MHILAIVGLIFRQVNGGFADLAVDGVASLFFSRPFVPKSVCIREKIRLILPPRTLLFSYLASLYAVAILNFRYYMDIGLTDLLLKSLLYKAGTLARVNPPFSPFSYHVNRPENFRHDSPLRLPLTEKSFF